MARAKREPLTGVWGRAQQHGLGAEPLVRSGGQWGEAESLLLFGAQRRAKFGAALDGFIGTYESGPAEQFSTTKTRSKVFCVCNKRVDACRFRNVKSMLSTGFIMARHVKGCIVEVDCCSCTNERGRGFEPARPL